MGQLPAHQSTADLLAIVGAERSGKSEFVGKEIVARLPYCQESVAIAAQEYDEAHKEMQYVIEGLDRLGALESANTPKSGKWYAKMREGPVVETVSLKNGVDELTTTGDAFDIVALVEWGVIEYAALDAAIGRTSETRGLVLCAGTLKDNVGWQVDVYNELEAEENVYSGACFSFPAWLNLEIYPGGRNDPEILRLERTLPGPEFGRRVAALIVPSPARVYPTFSVTTHTGGCEFDELLPVDLAVDAGYNPSHYAVAALQIVEESFELPTGGVVRMKVVRQIDEVWENFLTHQDVYAMCQERPWWRNVGFVLLGHEGKQHQAAASTQEVWQQLARDEGKRGMIDRRTREAGPFVVEVFDAGRVLDGIARVQTFLEDPGVKVARYRCAAKCKGTIYEFGHYRKPVDSQQKVRSEEPIDADNDAMDALRNYLVYRFGLVDREPQKPTGGRARSRMRV